MRRDPHPVEGPVELIDGRLFLRIPFEMGGMGSAALALGIGTVDSERLNVEIPPWLAEKLGIAAGSIVIVSIDTALGNFSIARSAGKNANTWGLSSSPKRTPPPERPAVPKASPVVPVSAYWNFTITTRSAGNDTPSGQSRSQWRIAFSRAPATRSLATLNAIAARWRRPLRWLLQGLAIAVGVVIVILLLT